MLIDRKIDSVSFVSSGFLVNYLISFIILLNLHQVVDGSCLSTAGKVGECRRFEDCETARLLSRKGVDPDYCKDGTVCCVPIGRRKLEELQSSYGESNQQDIHDGDSSVPRKKHSVDSNDRNYGKPKNTNNNYERPNKYENTGSADSESDITDKWRRPGFNKHTYVAQSEEEYFVPPGLAKKKPWRDERTTETDYYIEHVTKKITQRPTRKGPAGNNYEPPRRTDDWYSEGQRRTTTSNYDWQGSQNEYEGGRPNRRTTLKPNKWVQETYTTKRNDYYDSGPGNSYGDTEDEYSNVKPSRRPQRPFSNPSFEQGSRPQGNSRPGNRPQGNRPHDNRPGNRPQDNNRPGNRPQDNNRPGNRPQDNRPGSQQGSRPQENYRPGFQQGSTQENRPDYYEGSRPQENHQPDYQSGSSYENSQSGFQQGSSFGNNPSNFRPGSQKPRRISEQKCEEYSRDITQHITGLPLTTNPNPVTIPVRKCLHPQQLIVGGEKTSLGEFPHMAAIGFRDRNTNSVAWNCGGTLISELYVLTAAHCASTSSGRPVKVRLGEYNLRKNDDGAHPVDYSIVDIITHPEYKPPSKYNDIALLKLSRKVTFFKHIRPACLYIEDTLSASKAVATGWGRVVSDGPTSEILQKVVLNIVDNNFCNTLYKVNAKSEVLSRGIVETQLCAGDLRGDKDTCQGDSGGPLTITNTKCIHHIIGVTSFGKRCALPNTTGVYTRVSAYVPWIESVVWPTNLQLN